MVLLTSRVCHPLPCDVIVGIVTYNRKSYRNGIDRTLCSIMPRHHKWDCHIYADQLGWWFQGGQCRRFFLNRNGVDRNPLGPPGAALCSFSDMFEKVKQALSTRLGVAPVRSSALVATRDPIATATGNGMDLLSFWCRRCIDVLVSFLFFPMILLPLLPPGGFG